jgi:hypothetical protein
MSPRTENRPPEWSNPTLTDRRSHEPCDYHQDMTLLLSSVNTSLQNLIGLVKWALGLWFPVIIAGVVSGIFMFGEMAQVKLDVANIKAQRNYDHKGTAPLR